MPDRRVDRLNRPAGNNPSDMGRLKIGLIVARWREQSAEIDLVLIEAAYALGEAGVDDTGTENIFRSARHHAGIKISVVRQARRN